MVIIEKAKNGVFVLVNHDRLVTDEHFSRRRRRFVIPNFFVLLLDRGVAFLR